MWGSVKSTPVFCTLTQEKRQWNKKNYVNQAFLSQDLQPTSPVTGFVLNFFKYATIAWSSKIFPCLSQYGCSKGCRHKQQWSNGNLRKLDVSGPVLFPPYNVVHSVYVRYLTKTNTLIKAKSLNVTKLHINIYNQRYKSKCSWWLPYTNTAVQSSSQAACGHHQVWMLFTKSILNFNLTL